jgi:hypothetical protein
MEHVGVPVAKTIVVLSRPNIPREDSDAITLNVLLTMRNNGWPHNGLVVAQCGLVRNKQLFQRLMNDESKVVITNDFVGGLMVQCCRQKGLMNVAQEIFSFNGDEFYVANVSGTGGRTFLDVSLSLPGAILLGYVNSKGAVELLPKMSRTFEGDEQLVMLAEDVSTLPSEVAPLANHFGSVALTSAVASCAVKKLKITKEGEPQTIIILGWNEMIGAIMVDLDRMLADGSQVIVHSAIPEKDRIKVLDSTQKRRNYKFQVDIKHTLGPFSGRVRLEELPFEKVSTIFILGNTDPGISSSDSDAQTLAVILQVQDILLERCGPGGGPDVIMPQLLEIDSEETIIKMGLRDYLMSSLLTARIMAMIGVAPQVGAIISEIAKEHGCRFCIRRLTDYDMAKDSLTSTPAAQHTKDDSNGTPTFFIGDDDGPAPKDLDLSKGLCWRDVQAVVAMNNEIAIGWSQVDGAEAGPWEINPKKYH